VRTKALSSDSILILFARALLNGIGDAKAPSSPDWISCLGCHLANLENMGLYRRQSCQIVYHG
jgi:hypothetical protein